MPKVVERLLKTLNYQNLSKRKARKYAWEHKNLLISLRDSGMTLRQICDILRNKNINKVVKFRQLMFNQKTTKQEEINLL